MARKIFGSIHNVSGSASLVSGLKVQAWDDDFPDGDDFMGGDLTNANGQYEIAYDDKPWDNQSLEVINGRPDIYISVEIKNSLGKWVRLAKSQVFKNHELSKDLQIDLDVDITPPIQKKLAFLPSQHGFHFVNNFKISPEVLGINVGKWEMGFCGGMCAGSLQRFLSNESVPDVQDTPIEGTEVFGELLARQIRSFPPNLLPILYAWQSAPDESSTWLKPSIGLRTKAEWPKLKSELDKGCPTILVLIRANGYLDNPTKNHQVLAYGYEFNPATKDLTVYEYDPNLPNEEHTLTMSLGLPDGKLYLKDSTGKKTRGFLVNPEGLAASSQSRIGLIIRLH